MTASALMPWENALHDLRPRLIYVMPSYQNPTGHLMPMHRRRQLVRLAEQHRIPVLEDEVYREFRYDGDELPPLKALDESGVVIHTNAFTKVLLPGIRIGYLMLTALITSDSCGSSKRPISPPPA